MGKVVAGYMVIVTKTLKRFCLWLFGTNNFADNQRQFAASTADFQLSCRPNAFEKMASSDRLHKYITIGEHVVVAGVALAALNVLLTDGVSGLSRDFVRFLRKLPAVNYMIKAVLASEVKGAIRLLANESGADTKAAKEEVIPIPEKGVHHEVIMGKLKALYSNEKSREAGKGFAITYVSTSTMKELSDCMGSAYEQFCESTGSPEIAHEKLVAEAWKIFMFTNAISPNAYLSLRRLETEVISMCAWMVHGDANVAGTLTSGGTESVLMAVKTYRDRARKLCPHITTPNMIAPITVHPAFEKAAHYFGVEVIHVGLTPDYRVDVAAVAKAINSNTILLVGSAPQYCHGVVDPIEALAELALRRGLPLHVDACFGGFMMPWLEKLGWKIPLWDFRVNGVTSISADIHKYGYCPRGASVVLYRNAELRAHQFFAYATWPGGLFGSAAMAGSRPGGMIAASWTAVVAMGQDGYMKFAQQVADVTTRIVAAVDRIQGIKLVARPDMTALAIMSDDPKVNILALADVMEDKGWKMERQQNPNSLHMSVVPLHAQSVDELIVDLEAGVKHVYAHPELASAGTVGMYGMVAKIPDDSLVTDFIVRLFSGLYQRDAQTILD